EREDGRIRARQRPGGQGRAGGGPHGGDVRSVHDRGRRTRVRIERHDHRLVTGQAYVVVARKDGDQFGGERARTGQVRRHGGEEGVAPVDGRGHSRRRGGCPRRQLDHGGGN